MAQRREPRRGARGVEALIDDPQRGCRVTYLPHFLTEPEATALLSYLRDHAPFAAEAPVVMGRRHPLSRASCAFGEEGVRYRYSGILREAAPWPALLVPI